LILSILFSGCGSHDLKESTAPIAEDSINRRNHRGLVKPECSTQFIETWQGLLCGKRYKTSSGTFVNAYLGIPYAESTAGEGRWQPPKQVKSWNGVFKATEFGPICPQNAETNFSQSEDCLSLNIWTPDFNANQKELLPVMVFIHGGSFVYGSSTDPMYDGASLATNGKVNVVSMNYRLGVLGFLSVLKDKNTGQELNGNYGLLDQQLAMKWVKQNIRSFGGDPNKVTIFGESAGAMSVGIHAVAFPSSKGLFRAAIMESNPFGIPYKTLKDSRSIASKFAHHIGCDTDRISCLRGKSVEEILEAQIKKSLLPMLLHGLKDFLSWAPVVDGEVFTKQPIKAIGDGDFTIPLIIGTNKQEGVLFVDLAKSRTGITRLSPFDYHLILDFLFHNHDLRNRTLKIYPPLKGDNTDAFSRLTTDYLFTCANRYVAMHANKETWAYQFDQLSSFNIWNKFSACKNAVCHGDELPYVFQSAKHSGYESTPAENQLSLLIQHYWSSFATNLNPNGFGHEWPFFSSNHDHIIFNTPLTDIRIASDYDANCDLWDEISYDIHESWWEFF
jgi:carboxylesterase type B